MSYRVKLLILLLMPIILTTAAIVYVINKQALSLADANEQTVQSIIVEQKQNELRNYVELARHAITPLYHSHLKTRRQAQAEAKEILQKMSFGPDDYFFVFDGEGTNIVHPRLTYLVGGNWIGLKDANGKLVVKDLIEGAKRGGEFYDYIWRKPSTGDYVDKMGFSIYFPDWDWMVGTGVYMDDIGQQVSAVQTKIQRNIAQTQFVVMGLAIAGILATSLILGAFQVTQQRLADRQLQKLTSRIVDVQEQERKRVSRELHDGIGQLLVSSKYGMENALTQKGVGKIAQTAVQSSMAAIDSAIGEVRRVSRALRPSALDDVGLSAAINSLAHKFAEDTGIAAEIDVTPVRNLLSDDAKTALFRVAQEALTNVAKHADTDRVQVTLAHSRAYVILTIKDFGVGTSMRHLKTQVDGLGLRNIQERMRTFGGSAKFSRTSPSGFTVTVRIPVETDADKKST